MIAIGTAVWSPAIPTRGATIAPPIKGNNPNNAAALPTFFVCFCIANEKVVVDTIPTLETIINSAMERYSKDN